MRLVSQGLRILTPAPRADGSFATDRRSEKAKRTGRYELRLCR
jgi:hypothetical protein